MGRLRRFGSSIYERNCNIYNRVLLHIDGPYETHLNYGQNRYITIEQEQYTRVLSHPKIKVKNIYQRLGYGAVKTGLNFVTRQSQITIKKMRSRPSYFVDLPCLWNVQAQFLCKNAFNQVEVKKMHGILLLLISPI